MATTEPPHDGTPLPPADILPRRGETVAVRGTIGSDDAGVDVDGRRRSMALPGLCNIGGTAMTETLPRRTEQPMARDTRNIIRLLRAMRRDPSTLSVDEMSCVCALARSQHVVKSLSMLHHARKMDAATRYRVAELVRAVGDET